ncbi:MAG: DNA translocase FtsK [Acidimicrobiia bacterium]
MARTPRSGAGRSRPASGAARGPRLREHGPADPGPRVRGAAREPMLARLVEGRGAEFTGVGLVAAGALLLLSTYLRVAGPLGRFVDGVAGWALGGGRFVLPVLCVGIGWPLLRRKDWEARARVGAGWSLVLVVALALAHVWLSGDGERVGGWVGVGIGAPLAALLSGVGASVLLLAALLVALMMASGKSAPELWSLVRGASRGGWRMIARSDDADDGRDEHDEQVPVDVPPGFEGASQYRDPSPRDADIYDLERDDPDAAAVRDERPASRPSRADRAPSTPRRSAAAPARGVPQRMPLGPTAQPSVWELPSLDLLALTANRKADEEAVAERGEQLVAALAAHGVDTELVGYTRGPTVTRYELALGEGVKVARVTSLSRDIAYTMAATDVRILAPIPGRSAIGIEVPNEARELVSLGDLLVSPDARTAAHPLDVAIGKDIAGRPVFLNVASTPHLLIAGATGAGKSSVLNCMITSILMRATPEQVRLILIDPKQVEMSQYAHLPHLLTAPVTNPKKAAHALGWAVKEMERRYDVLVEAGFRDVVGYNAAWDRGELQGDESPRPDAVFERLPYVVVVVDELNDLMMVAARDVEDCITRIAQKARAVGIHLIVATQRPSVNVITGVIKANIPARMAFAVSSLTDSRVILDQPGAEKLVGRGDMLMLPGNTNVAQRVQSAWVGEGEVRKIVAQWRRQAPEVVYVSGIDGEAPEGAVGLPGGGTGDEDDDDLLRQAMELVVRTGLGSTSMLQRKLKVGFARAGRLMDLLEQRGVVGPSEGSRARDVLMTVEELEALQRAS